LAAFKAELVLGQFKNVSGRHEFSEPSMQQMHGIYSVMHGQCMEFMDSAINAATKCLHIPSLQVQNM
jgi:hypothetical protein